ncbi:MAG: hypothetical protein BroJett007_10040 [Chloroflexota bacterium]|nr:MAG: hypothetical protein BroJett007_10040 [Chloroflexota bacterium]
MRRLIVIAAVVLAGFIAFDLYPGLRGGAGWQWAYQPPPDVVAVIALTAGLTVYVVVTALLRARRAVRTVLAWTVFGGTVLAYLAVSIRGDPFFLLFTRTVSPVQTGAASLQTSIMARDGVLPTLRRWPEVMDEALTLNLIHFTTSPPGQVLAHQALADVFDSPALHGLAAPVSQAWRMYQCHDIDVMWYSRGEIMAAGLFAFLMPLLAALAALPIFGIARDLTGDRMLAARIAGWWALVPAVLMFAPTWNTLYSTLCALAFWLLLRGLRSEQMGWVLGAGLVTALTTFLNFAVLPFLLLAGLFTLGWCALTPRPPLPQGEGENSGQDSGSALTPRPPLPQGEGENSGRDSGSTLTPRPPLPQGEGENSGQDSGSTLTPRPPLPQGEGKNSGRDSGSTLTPRPPLPQGEGENSGRDPDSALGTQHSALSTRHSALGTRHSALNTRHFALLRAAWVGLVFGIGLAAPWIAYTVVTGVSPLDILRVTFGSHSELVQRAYLPWLLLHPYDVLLFTGLPASILAIWGAVRAIRLWRWDSLTVFALAMAVTIVAVDVAGIVQGENARILSFYMPFLLLMGAVVLRERASRYDLPLFGAQALVVLAMAAVLYVVPLDLDPMPDGPRQDIGGLGDVAWTDADEALWSTVRTVDPGAFTLEQYRWVGDPSRQALTYEFEFHGHTPAERPYQFELVATAQTDEGTIVSDPFRWWAQGASYPPTCWRNGEVIRDTVVMPLPPVPHPVVWTVTLRAVDERTGRVLPVVGQDALTLAPVSYP